MLQDNQYDTLYKEGDQLMVVGAQPPVAATFTVPQSIGFNGICMSSIGIEFLKDIKPETCHHYITDVSRAANTFLKPDMYGGSNFLGNDGKILTGLGNI